MSNYLLLGAGFSRNWGGWLAAEIFEYLIGLKTVREHSEVLNQLWLKQTTPEGGGFEAALDHFQKRYLRNQRQPFAKVQMDALQLASVEAIRTMDKHLSAASDTFNISEGVHNGVNDFLSRFDAIFTLNQDTLLERSYIVNNFAQTSGRWMGSYMPGIALNQHEFSSHDVPKEKLISQKAVNKFETKLQPILKLHGSWNWKNPNNSELIVMGGGKGAAIQSSPLLQSYHSFFSHCLRQPGARLMVVGYGFGDAHINVQIERACSPEGDLKLFIVDPLGYKLLGNEKNSGRQATNSEKALMGSSRRSFNEIFGSKNDVEYQKVIKFLNEGDS